MREMVKSRLFSLLLILCIFALGASLGRTVDWQYINEAATKLQGLTIGGTSAGDPVTIDGTQTLTNKTISGGTLSGSITNNATINGGTLSGTITNNATINGGAYTVPSINGSQLNASGGQLNLTQYLVSTIHRSKFVYNGDSTAYTIKVGGGVYVVKDKIARWNSELTTSAISSPAADTRYYLYLDYDSITSETLITNGNLIWSTTAPTPSNQYKGHYNGDDLCIFGVITDDSPSNILKFYHNGRDYISWDIQPYVGLLSDNDWTEIDFSDYMPAFSIEARVSVFCMSFSSGYSGDFHWREKGSSASQGKRIAHGEWKDSGSEVDSATENIITDSSNIFEYKLDFSQLRAELFVNGWYFPQGM